MYFYEFILVTLFIYASNNADLVIDSGINTLSPCSVGIIFFMRLNNTSDEDCHVEVTPDVCCLNDDENDILKIMGGCTCDIPKGKSKFLKLVAPILDPYERQGYCYVYVDSKSERQINKREIVKINFDTSIQNQNEESKIKQCKNKDEDPFNNCEPVDCGQFYNGRKPFYNKIVKRCVDVPHCLVTDDTYSDVVYNPVSNKCIKKSIVKRDIKALKRLNYNNKGRISKDVIIITNDTELAKETNNAVDMIEVNINDNAKQSPNKQVIKHHNPNNNLLLSSFIVEYFKNYSCVVILLGSVIIIQCIFISVMCCWKRKCPCASDKVVVRKFFNNCPEDSITTPLISASIMDTGTIENHFLSELSSNTAKQMKSYKACDKGNKESIKVCMSDDILSKCLNRRDWKNHHKSVTPEHESITDIRKITQPGTDRLDLDSNNGYKSTDLNETNVAFEDETLRNENNKPMNCFVNDDKSVNRTVDLMRHSDEIHSLDYNCYDTNTECRRITENKSDSATKMKSGSTEKAAQTYFSKDSIDAILSERGYIYLAGGDLSKYTLSGESDKVRSTEISNKASKNIVKYFHSLLQRRSKHGSQSDPGREKDLQLIHMSKASLYSSSNDEE